MKNKKTKKVSKKHKHVSKTAIIISIVILAILVGVIIFFLLTANNNKQTIKNKTTKTKEDTTEKLTEEVEETPDYSGIYFDDTADTVPFNHIAFIEIKNDGTWVKQTAFCHGTVTYEGTYKVENQGSEYVIIMTTKDSTFYMKKEDENTLVFYKDSGNQIGVITDEFIKTMVYGCEETQLKWYKNENEEPEYREDRIIDTGDYHEGENAS